MGVRSRIGRADRRSLALAVIGALLAPSVAADPFHHQAIPLGEHALGMGGAFAGVADDASAAYYNPAGLAQLTDSAISASLTLNAFDRYEIRRGYRTVQGTADLEHTSQPRVPLFVSVVKQVGPRDLDGRRRHAIALSTFTIDERRLNFDISLSGAADADTVIENFTAQTEHSTVWYGLSYAYRISDELSVGASAFLDVERARHAEERLTVTLGSFDETSGTYENPTSTLESRLVESDVKNLVGRVGVLWALRPGWRLGATLQPQSARLRGRATVRDRVFFSYAAVDGADAYATYYEDEQEVTARAPSGWQLRVGGSYQASERLALALDVNVSAPLGSEDDPIEVIGELEPDPETGQQPWPGDLFLDHWYTKLTGNVAVGVQAQIHEAVVVRGGLFTDLSAAPDSEAEAQSPQPPDVDRFGAALSVRWTSDGYDLSVGAAGRFGRGDAMAYSTVDLDFPFQRTSVRDDTFFVFLSGAKRAAGKLAKAAYRRVRDRDAPDSTSEGSGAP